MPELPEVETVRRQMETLLTGRKITTLQTNRADLRWPLPTNLAHALTGRAFKRFDRHGKYILAYMDDDTVLGVHLGMSGAFLHNEKQETRVPGKHDHVIFNLDNGATLTFNDPRRFGALFLTDAQAWRQDKMLANKGRDPITEGLEADWLYERLQHRKGPIKTVLLDQGVLAGLGNIYVVEALFESHIHPDRPANSLNKAETRRLAPAILKVLHKAIDLKGTTLRNYQHLDGGVGNFQDEFKVYGRKGLPCPVCQAPHLIVREVHAGRATFYCPRCQK